MILQIKLDPGASMPTRAHRWDAGMDLYAMEGDIVDYMASFDTGVHVNIPEGFVGFIKSRSGMMSKYGITTDGTIDSGYTGSIKVTLINRGPTSYLVNPGDRIAQLVILPCAFFDMEQVDEMPETDRGEGGFGSTGK